MAKSTAPLKAEATNAGTSFEFDGTVYTVPPVAEWDVEVLESVEDGRIAAACRALLGADQWATFRSKRRTVTDLRALYETVEAALGTSGN